MAVGAVTILLNLVLYNLRTDFSDRLLPRPDYLDGCAEAAICLEPILAGYLSWFAGGGCGA